MSIYKNGDFYRADVFVGSKKITSKSGFKNKAQAKNWHDKVKFEFQNGEVSNFIKKQEIEKRYFDDLIESFLVNHVEHHVKFRTAARYKLDIKTRIRPFFGNMTVNSISQTIIFHFQNKLKASKLAASSVNHTMVVLNSIFEKGITWGLCNNNPCKGVRPLKLVEKPFRCWLNVEHIIQFLNANRGSHYFPIFKLALETGLRLGEIIGLQKESIDYITGKVVVFQQYDPLQKKLVPIKNNKVRYVWVTDEMLTILKQLRGLNPHSSYAFTDTKGNVLEATKLAKWEFRKAQRIADVPYINFHGLRHTFASHFMMNGGSLYDLKSLLGHSTIDVTERYAHLSLDSLQKTRNLVSFDTSNIRGIFQNSPTFHPPVQKIG